MSIVLVASLVGCDLPEIPDDLGPPDAASQDASGDGVDAGRDDGPAVDDAGLGPEVRDSDIEIPLDVPPEMDIPSDLSPPPPTLARVAEEVFAEACSPCHIDQSRGGLSLRHDGELRARLLAPSIQVPQLDRVEPGSLGDSYLWIKVQGEQESVGGLGEAMPLTDGLSDYQVDLLRRWIVGGAD